MATYWTVPDSSSAGNNALNADTQGTPIEIEFTGVEDFDYVDANNDGVPEYDPDTQVSLVSDPTGVYNFSVHMVGYLPDPTENQNNKINNVTDDTGSNPIDMSDALVIIIEIYEDTGVLGDPSDDTYVGRYMVFPEYDSTVFTEGHATKGTGGNGFPYSGVQLTRYDYTPDPDQPFCFVAGTKVETENGLIAVEDLAEGDLLRCLDGKARAVKWVGSSVKPAKGNLAPIVFTKGAIGNSKELLLSPQHRVFLSGWKAELLFGASEVLVKAKDLVNGDTIYRRDGDTVAYYHVLLDSHEIIFANGAMAETLYLGDEALKAMDAEAREEIKTLFPELLAGDVPAGHKAVKVQSLKSFEASALQS